MFTIVHLHLLLNHLPIIVTSLALLLVAIAAWRGNDYLARVALAFFIGGALSALPSYLTGEGAEEAVEDLAGVSRDLIERHQDIALVSALVIGALGVLAAWALWRYRRSATVPRIIVRGMLVGGIVGVAHGLHRLARRADSPQRGAGRIRGTRAGRRWDWRYIPTRNCRQQRVAMKQRVA